MSLNMAAQIKNFKLLNSVLSQFKKKKKKSFYFYMKNFVNPFFPLFLNVFFPLFYNYNFF